MKRKEVIVTKGVGAPLSDDPEDASRRLSNIRPREVSLVDAAANGRSFLVVKRRGEDMKKKDQTLFKGEKGGEGEAKPAGEPAVAAAAPTPVKKTEGEEPTVTPAAEGGEGAAKDTPVEKGVFTKMAEEFLGGIPIAKALVMEQKSMFMAMSDALMSIAMSLDMIRMDLMSFNNSDGKTGFMGEEVVKSLKGEFPEASEAELLEKAGRKMKQDRLAKFKEAIGILENLVKELDENNEVKKGGGTVNKKEGTDKKDQETQKSADGKAAETPPAAAPAEGKAGETITVSKDDLNKLIEENVTKAVKPLQDEIAALKNAPAESAGEGAEGTEDVETNKSKDGKGGKGESIFKGVIR